MFDGWNRLRGTNNCFQHRLLLALSLPNRNLKSLPQNHPGTYWAYKGRTWTCRLRFSWNFQDFKIVVWEGTPVQNLLPQSIFFCLKNCVKNWTKNVKTRKIANILETAGSIAKSSKFQFWALLSGVLQGKITGLKIYRKNFCSKLNVIFKAVKMNSGGKFGSWVSFYTTTFKSWKFKENLGRTVVVLPLLVRGLNIFLSGGFHIAGIFFPTNIYLRVKGALITNWIKHFTHWIKY